MLDVSAHKGRIYRADGSSRAALLPGALVVLAAVIGADIAITAGSYQRMHTTAAVVARATVPSASPVFGMDDVAWLAALLLIACLVRCGSTFTSADSSTKAYGTDCQAGAVGILQRKFALSFRSGGLYGP